MKKFWPILAMAFVLACQAVFPTPTATPRPTETLTPSPLPTFTRTPTEVPPTETPTDTPTPAPTFIQVRLDPHDGALGELLYAESQKAAALGMLPVIEFDASW